VDERDLLVVSALQDAPRARWTDLARILELGEDTVAERWRRLAHTGQAWISLVDRQHVSGRSLTFVLLRTASAQRAAVVAAVLPHPLVRTVHHTSGSHDLSLLVETAEPAEIARFLDEVIEPLGGINELRVLPSVSVITTAARWRTTALDGSQRRALAELDRAGVASSGTGVDDDLARRDPVVGALVEELAVDGRMPVADLVRNLEVHHGVRVSASTVTRKLARLLAVPSLRIRCDISGAELGWHAVVMLWCRVSSHDAARLVADRAGAEESVHRVLPETRSMMVVAGSVNLHLTLWLHTLGGLPDAEVRLAEWLPSVEVVDRSVCLSTAKRMGFPLVDGRRLSPLSG
jgi:DNA-binding Lrp family transcriptional regulator